MKLSDEAIGQIAKIVQVAILTGTDVVDNLRMIELKEDNKTLCLTEEYKKAFETNLNKMIQEVNQKEDT